jgi:hypothetical protein
VERTRIRGLERIEVVLMFESQFDGLEFLLGTGGEVSDGAVVDFAVKAEGLAKEDAAIGFAVGSGFGAVEIHSEHTIMIYVRIDKHIIDIISGYTISAKYGDYVGYQLLRDFG